MLGGIIIEREKSDKPHVTQNQSQVPGLSCSFDLVLSLSYNNTPLGHIPGNWRLYMLFV